MYSCTISTGFVQAGLLAGWGLVSLGLLSCERIFLTRWAGPDGIADFSHIRLANHPSVLDAVGWVFWPIKLSPVWPSYVLWRRIRAPYENVVGRLLHPARKRIGAILHSCRCPNGSQYEI